MNKKIIFSLLIISLFILSFSSLVFASTNMNNAKNAVMNAGNSVGNAISDTAGAVTNGAKDLANDAKMLGQDSMNTMNNIGSDIKSDSTDVLDTADGDYSAARTSVDDTNVLGLSSNSWTWLILAFVGIAIVALVWYYGAQFEHRNYDND